MRASETSSTGGVGVTEVCGLFERIRWAPLENRDRHDLGTDLLVAARDPRRFDRGVLIGVQVKAGPTAFDEAEKDASGSIIGWWHREDSEHFDYWIKHHLPHLLVLYDATSREGYWAHVTAERCQSTGKGIKILVLKQDTIGLADAPKLLEIALAQRGSTSLEGTSFDAAAAHIAPGDRMRYALLIPRLIAPHANRGEVEAVEPEEAIALLVLLHVQRLRLLLKKNAAWPELDKEPKSADWRWHFAHAIWRFIAFGDCDPLRASHSQASRSKTPRSDWRVAASVVLASAEFLAGRTQSAASTIDGELNKDAAAPIDHAWLHLHAGHCAAELGANDDAKEHAAMALANLRGASDEPTASLLSGIGYRIIFNLGGWQESSRNMSATLKAADNAGSWWRDQQLRWALDAAALENFRTWTKDASSRWEAEPPGQQMMPSMLMALFSADHAGWAAAQSRLGRYEIQHSKNGDHFRSAFVRLLRSGDQSSVVLAGRHALNFGPAVELSKLSAACVPRFMAPKRVETLLAFWKEFGDLGQSHPADEVLSWCLVQAGQASVALEKPTQIDPRILDAISSTLPVASDSVFRQVAASLGQFSFNPHDLDRFCRVAEAVERRDSSSLDCELLVAIARRHPGASGATALFGLAASAGSDEAREELIRLADAGDLLAGAIAFDADLLPEGSAASAAQMIIDLLEKERLDASNGRIGYGRSVDFCNFLVALFLAFSKIARWPVVVDYITDRHVIADHKEAACRQIIRKKEMVPREVIDGLLACISDLASSRYIQANLFDVNSTRLTAADLAAFVGFALRDPSDDDVEAYVNTALTRGGSSKNWAWEALSNFGPPGYDLLAIQAQDDEDIAVRVRAAHFLGRRISGQDESTMLRLAAERLLANQGVTVTKALLRTLMDECPTWARVLIDPLRSHYSASVRKMAEHITIETS
ncbi:MAG: DUF4365 domain-containing protein [Lysobacterales bacterium]